MQQKKRELGIYLHIPFCIRKCRYCDFLSAPAAAETRSRYVKALIREIRAFAPTEEYQVVSVFFGGGTPSLLLPQEMKDLMQELRTRFPFWDEAAEITVECNPGTLTEEKLRAYKTAGINRLSIGLQSADNRELALLGRIHTWEEFLDNYYLARKVGFQNINVDLMSGLPGQTMESWIRTLRQVLDLKPEHISAYSLIIEEGTDFFDVYGEDALRRERGEECRSLPTEEMDRAMYEQTELILGNAGLQRYEISNYAIPGYESRHNSGYWKRREYIGFGLGASSQLRNLRFSNDSDLQNYLLQYDMQKQSDQSSERQDGTVDTFFAQKCSLEDTQILTRLDEIEETMFLGLRMIKGVSFEEFRERFGEDLMDRYGDVIQKWSGQKMLTSDAGSLRLTKDGIDVSNIILADFIL